MKSSTSKESSSSVIENILNSDKDILDFDSEEKTISLTHNDVEYDIKILDIIGSSITTIYNIVINGNITKYCLKLAPAGSLKLDDYKIDIINSNSDCFVKVLYFHPKIKLYEPFVLFDKEWDDFDMLIVEKANTTLETVCNSLKHYQYVNLTMIDCLIKKLLIISNLLIDNGYYYEDFKPSNIGIFNHENQSTFKLLDIESILRIPNKQMFKNVKYTPYITGYISKKSIDNIYRVQLLSIFFTVFAILFNNKHYLMCNPEFYNIGINENALNDLLTSIEKNIIINDIPLKCSQYKYIILLSTYVFSYKYISDSMDSNQRVQLYIQNYDDITNDISNYLSDGNPNNYSIFIAKLMYSILLIILVYDSNINNIQDSKNMKHSNTILIQDLLIKLYLVNNNQYIDTSDIVYNSQSYIINDPTIRTSFNLGYVIIDKLYKYMINYYDSYDNDYYDSVKFLKYVSNN